MPSGRAPLRWICAYNNSRQFCCLPGLPGPRRGSGHSGPTTLALAFCCSSTSSLGGSSGRSRASAPFTTHLVNDMLRACKQLVQTPAHMHARFAHWGCPVCVLRVCAIVLSFLSCPVLANFKWECITRYCSRNRCLRNKGRSVLCLCCFICMCFVYLAIVGTINKL